MKKPAPDWQISTWQELGRDEVYAILRCRVDVFVVEQQCAYGELDGKDRAALHLAGRDKSGDIVAYARILPPLPGFPGPAIGRILVARHARGNKLGKELVRKAIEVCRQKFGRQPIFISAQLPLKNYYASLGFVPQGKPYNEDGIRHIRMQLPT